jgi:hypothetical protein
VSPSPKNKTKRTTVGKKVDVVVASSDSEEEEEEKKPAAKRKNADRTEIPKDPSTNAASAVKKKKRSTAPTATVSILEKVTASTSKPRQKKAVAKVAVVAAAAVKTKEKKKSNTARVVLRDDSTADENDVNDADENIRGGNGNNGVDDGSDEDDRPFKIEYSKSGRARCVTCDVIIPQGCLRVSCRPLFRGKQGFQVFRHLPCAVFSDDIQRPEDVGGWNQLKAEDMENLATRIEESKMERQKENEDLEPDELVQQKFQGEIRKPPVDLTATLLPFQVEGLSWMYHQETKIPDIKGGILADEMGMVGWDLCLVLSRLGL